MSKSVNELIYVLLNGGKLNALAIAKDIIPVNNINIYNFVIFITKTYTTNMKIFINGLNK